MSHCTLLHKISLHFFPMAPIHTGAPYNMRGKMAPLYMVLNALCFSPHLNFTDLANACISLVHCPAVYMMCSLKFSLLSMMIPRYFYYAR